MLFENRRADPGHFKLECIKGQNILRPLPEPTFANVRFFMRGTAMDGTDGWASRTMNGIASTLDPSDLGADFGTRPLIAPYQVHGVKILVIKSNSDALAVPTYPKADGILLLSRDFEASLRFGDCAAVLVLPSEQWAHEHQPWALLMHSGYKGTVQNIIASGIKAVRQELSELACDAQDAIHEARAWVFPCISGNDYPRTLEDWTKRGLETFRPENVRHTGQDGQEPEHYYFDLAGELRLQLLDCGLNDANIYLSLWTSAGDPDLCYSHRRGDGDRMFLHVTLN